MSRRFCLRGYFEGPFAGANRVAKIISHDGDSFAAFMHSNKNCGGEAVS